MIRGTMAAWSGRPVLPDKDTRPQPPLDPVAFGPAKPAPEWQRCTARVSLPFTGASVPCEEGARSSAFCLRHGVRCDAHACGCATRVVCTATGRSAPCTGTGGWYYRTRPAARPGWLDSFRECAGHGIRCLAHPCCGRAGSVELRP